MEPVTLTTARLELSAPMEDDVDTITPACQDPAIQQFTRVPVPYRPADAEGFVTLTESWWEIGATATWAVREEGELVGMIGLGGAAGSQDREIGFWLVPDVRGRGIMPEAAAAVIDWGFSDTGLGLERIEWRAARGNLGSARVARKIGIRYEGLLRRAVVHGGGRLRSDAWIGGIVRDDDRAPWPWPQLA